MFRQIFTNGREAQDINGRLVVAPGTPLRQPNFGRMRLRVSDADSWYKGLTVSVTRRGADLQLQASYTLGKSEDTGAAALGGNDYENEGGGSRYLSMKEKGLSPFDVRQSLVASVNWMCPLDAGGTAPRRPLIRDWSVSTLIRLKASDPFLGEHRRARARAAARRAGLSRPVPRSEREPRARRACCAISIKRPGLQPVGVIGNARGTRSSGREAPPST